MGLFSAIGDVVHGAEDVFGDATGGNFLSELMNAFEGNQQHNDGTMGSVENIASEALPIVAAFL